jgi:hypothetical protein
MQHEIRLQAYYTMLNNFDMAYFENTTIGRGLHILQDDVNQLEQFSKFLNGTDANSIQSKLSHSIKDTLFDKIRIAETKKIARVSMEVTSLNEMLKGYLATSGDSKLRGV